MHVDDRTLRHVLPNILAPLIVQSTLAIATAVIAEAGLSFAGRMPADLASVI